MSQLAHIWADQEVEGGLGCNQFLAITLKIPPLSSSKCSAMNWIPAFTWIFLSSQNIWGLPLCTHEIPIWVDYRPPQIEGHLRVLYSSLWPSTHAMKWNGVGFIKSKPTITSHQSGMGKEQEVSEFSVGYLLLYVVRQWTFWSCWCGCVKMFCSSGQDVLSHWEERGEDCGLRESQSTDSL